MKITFLCILLFTILVFSLMILISFMYKRKNTIIESFCKKQKTDPMGDLNDDRVLLNYAPQENIINISCDDYWREEPLEFNNNLVEQKAVRLNSNYLDLAPEKKFGDNSYRKGLIDFNKLAEISRDEEDEDFLAKFEEKLVDPITKKKLKYQYELNYAYRDMNNKSWVNRWVQYNPNKVNVFDYSEISSDINDINTLNQEFLSRFNTRQKNLLTQKQLILFGLQKFQIFKYKLLKIEYYENYTLYTIEVALFRSTDYYINIFTYLGCIMNNTPKLFSVRYIGGNATDNYLLSDFFDPKELKQEIINDKYTNKVIFNKNADAIANSVKEYQESFKIKNQYACFNINGSSKDESYVLPYFTKEECESMYDTYGSPKPVGIYDYPCKTNEECPFYKLNKNYENDFGKCQADGKCELPINMEGIGYHYFKPNKEPVCYNCDSTEFEAYGYLDSCCSEQNNKEKYGFLETPDFAFAGDGQKRQNFYREKHCIRDVNSILHCS